MTGSQRRYGGSRLRQESDERKSNRYGRRVRECRNVHHERRKREDYDSAALLRGRWCRSGCSRGTRGKRGRTGAVPEQENRDTAREKERAWREGGKRRKQKAIAYERQLAPLMARETKQRSEAPSSNTIKPMVRASRSRGQERTRRTRRWLRRRWRTWGG